MADLFAADIPDVPDEAPRADAPLADRLRPRALDEVIGHLDGRQVTPQELQAHATSVPFLSANRLVIVEGLLQALGGPVQILTAGKVAELFHPDWESNDRRLAATLGLVPQFDLASGFRETVAWYRRANWL